MMYTLLALAAEGVSVILGVPSMYRLMARAQRAKPRSLPALRLLRRLTAMRPDLLHFAARDAAGLAPVPGAQVMPVDPDANFPSRAIVSVSEPDSAFSAWIAMPL